MVGIRRKQGEGRPSRNEQDLRRVWDRLIAEATTQRERDEINEIFGRELAA